MRTATLLFGAVLALAVAATVSVADDVGIGALLRGTVLDQQMDAMAPMGWAIYRDENGNYWKVRFLECDRVPGFTCPREVLYRYAIKPTRRL